MLILNLSEYWSILEIDREMKINRDGIISQHYKNKSNDATLTLKSNSMKIIINNTKATVWRKKLLWIL